MAAKQKRKAGGKSGSAPKRTKAVRKQAGESQMPIERAVDLAIQVHRSGLRTGKAEALREARVLYERILEADPKRPDALHYYGILLHNLGETERGIAQIRKALAIVPNYADAWSNLGNLLKESGSHAQAALAYQQAIDLSPEHADAHSNRGAVLAAEGKLGAAVEAYQQALTLDPDHVSAHHNIANVLHRLGRRAEAIGHYRKAISLDPKHPDARKVLAQALYYDGKVDEAIEVLRGWVKLEPNNPVAQHMLAACTGQGVPDRASDEYVQRAFDALATTFDDHLKGLQYRAPELIEAGMKAHVAAPSGTLEVLDAGVGTGLCGRFLRPYARRLVGVDLSEGMLAKARPLGFYDDLVQGELTAFLEGAPDSFDVVVSADTLCYFGDLRAVAKATASSLRTNGVVLFTVEKTPGDDAAGYHLHPHGRYSHAERYVREVLALAGLTVLAIETVTLRQERTEPVWGLLVTARKAP